MDKRWKALTAPVWAELRRDKSIERLMYDPHETGIEPLPRDLQRVFSDYTILKLLKLRRARLAGECPVYWALAHK